MRSYHNLSRRSFLKSGSAAAACAPFITLIPRADAQTRKFDPTYRRLDAFLSDIVE